MTDKSVSVRYMTLDGWPLGETYVVLPNSYSMFFVVILLLGNSGSFLVDAAGLAKV